MSVKSGLRSVLQSDTEFAHLTKSMPVIAGAVSMAMGLILATVAVPDRMMLFWDGVALIGCYMLFVRWINGARRTHPIRERLHWMVERTPAPTPILTAPRKAA